MKHLLKVTGDITSADYDRILLSEDGSVISRLGGGVKPVEPDYNGHEYVDLGLPSGILWADRNIGASSPEETGLYFEWGGIQGYTTNRVGNGGGRKAFSFDFSDYKFGKSPFTKYNSTDGKTTLDPEDDAAHVNMGGDWRTPTKEECQELIDNTTNEWIKDYNGTGVSGRIFTSKVNGNSIFVPAAGFAGNGRINWVGSEGGGYLWSSSLYENNVDNVWSWSFGSFNTGVTYTNGRYYGFSVRAVIK